jgi:putative DNA methylase
MVWDFCETNPFGGSVGDWMSIIDLELNAIRGALQTGTNPASVARASATDLPYHDQYFDAIVTDPPYYDNVPYADLSDFFYVWLKRSIGHIYPEHFASELTPKKREAIADSGRHGGSKERAKQAYETMMSRAFLEAHRVLKPNGTITVVYAHKTTLGWTTLVNSLRGAGFTVTQAWPLDTELRTRLRSRDSSALASSIFLVARKRDEAALGDYESQVQPELARVVRERVETLWEMGISGADLVIACVGAGLRAFTRFARVEYANGEEMPAERFLTEVETVVLDAILQKLSKAVGGNGSRSRSLAGLDPATRFYVLWRYTYGAAELDAGEAIIFANGTHVELDGPLGLSNGSRALVEKKKAKYKLRDFAERGDDDRLGLPDDDTAESRVTIDVLHRLLWLLEKRPPLIPEFITEAQPNLDQLRLVAQALAGPALKGGELENVSPTAEQSALGKLLANWSTVMEGKAAREDRRVGQQSLGI